MDQAEASGDGGERWDARYGIILLLDRFRSIEHYRERGNLIAVTVTRLHKVYKLFHPRCPPRIADLSAYLRYFIAFRLTKNFII